NIAAKQSVSEIKRQKETEEAGTDYQIVRQYQVGVRSYDRPKFLSKEKRDSAEIGTLMHAVMQHLPLQKGGLKEDEIKPFVQSLIDQGVLPEDAIGDLRLDLVHAFTHSNVYECLVDWKSTRLNSSHVSISYAVFCLKKKKSNRSSS